MLTLLLSRKILSAIFFVSISASYAKVGLKFAKNIVNTAKCTLTSSEISDIDRAIQRERMLCATCPLPSNLSAFLNRKFETATARELTNDLWGNELVYNVSGSSYEIRSLGPNRSDSSDDLFIKRQNGKIIAKQTSFKETDILEAIEVIEEERKKTAEALEQSRLQADEILENIGEEDVEALEKALEDFE